MTSLETSRRLVIVVITAMYHNAAQCLNVKARTDTSCHSKDPPFLK